MSLTKQFAKKSRRSYVRKYSLEDASLIACELGAWFGKIPENFPLDLIPWEEDQFIVRLKNADWVEISSIPDESNPYRVQNEEVLIDPKLLKQVKVSWLRKAKIFISPKLKWVKFQAGDEYFILPCIVKKRR